MDVKGKRVFLAGPMAGKVGLNRSEFSLAADVLRELGAADVYNPACTLMSQLVEQGKRPISRAMRENYRYLVCHCDLLVLLPGWRDSAGAMREYCIASDIGIPHVEYSEVGE